MTLELQHISKSYDGLPVLKNLNQIGRAHV